MTSFGPRVAPAGDPTTTRKGVPMIRKLSTLAALALCAFMAPAAAYAQQSGGAARGPEKAFERLDRNKDGVVDEKEAAAPGEKLFKRIDKNKDGVLEADEVKAFIDKRKARNEQAGERLERKLKRLDKDGDGKITEKEAVAPPRWFARADKDKDGKVTKSEIEDFAAKRGDKADKKAEKKKAKDDAADVDDDADDGDDGDDGEN